MKSTSTHNLRNATLHMLCTQPVASTHTGDVLSVQKIRLDKQTWRLVILSLTTDLRAETCHRVLPNTMDHSILCF